MALTIDNAKKNVQNYYTLNNPTDEDDFLFTESLEYLIHKTNKSEYMMDLGGWYYGRKQFDLAEEYYLMAAELKNTSAYSGLGYIYYYGRTGTPNYELAFKYYSLASESGDIECTYKVADMYRNGYYVEKNYEKYVEIMKSLYPKICNARNIFAPLPQIYSRLAKIYRDEGDISQAIDLLVIAKNFMTHRLKYSTFFGDLTIMKYLILDLYQLVELDPTEVDLFDLYYVLQSPTKVIISINNEPHIIETKKDGNMLYITMDDKNYENVDEFFSRALIDDTHITALYFNVDYLELISWQSSK